MKKLINLIRRFFTLFILKLTPSGRKELMYEKALSNMKEAHVLTTLERRILKTRVHFYINKTLSRKKISGHQMGVLIFRKFEKELEDSGLAYNQFTYSMVDLVERRKKRSAKIRAQHA